MREIELQKFTLKEKFLLYNWFNDYENIKFKIKTKNKISLRDHITWLQKFTKQKLGKIWIINYNKVKIGNIRITYIKKKHFEIDIFLEKKYRGLNLASICLKKIEGNLKRGTIVYSHIKKNNIKSLKFFTKNQYLRFYSTKEVWFLKKKI